MPNSTAPPDPIITPSLEEDFRNWRRNAKPEDLPEVESFITSIINARQKAAENGTLYSDQ